MNLKYFISLVFLFMVVGTTQAMPDSPESYQQYFQSVHEFGDAESLTNEFQKFFIGEVGYVVEVNETSTEIYQLNDNLGILTPHFTISRGGVDATIGDIDDNGIDDIIICGTSSEIWFGVDDGTFENPEPIGNCNGISTANLDGQNGDEAVMATDNGILVLRYDQNNPAVFNVVQIISSGVIFNDVALAPLNGSTQDLFAVSDNSDLVMEGNGDGTFSVSSQPFMNKGENQGGTKVLFQDYDLDGYGDAFVVAPWGGHAWKGNSDGFHKFVIPNFILSCNDVALGEFDDEPGLDIVFSCDTRSWFYTGIQLEDWGQTFLSGASTVLSMDLDSDGDDDIIFGFPGATNVVYKGGPQRIIATVNPNSFDLTVERDQFNEQMFIVQLLGSGVKFAQIQETAQWIDIPTKDLTYSVGQFVKFGANGLPAGEYSSQVSVFTNDPEREVFRVPAILTVTAAKLTMDPAEIVETSTCGSRKVALEVTNTGTTDMQFWVQPSNSWITTDVSAGSLETGATISMVVTLNPIGLEVGENYGEVVLTNNKTYLPNTIIPVSFTTNCSTVFLPVVIRP